MEVLAVANPNPEAREGQARTISRVEKLRFGALDVKVTTGTFQEKPLRRR